MTHCKLSLISVADMYLVINGGLLSNHFIWRRVAGCTILYQQDTFSLACKKPTAIQSTNRCVRNVVNVMRSSHLACTLRIVSLRNKPL